MQMLKPKEYIPQTVTHPGATLKEKLDELGMSQKEFAVRTTMPTPMRTETGLKRLTTP